ncbi:MAG TPA: hypothetical protein DCS93_39075 [Microscillaceae bacterium]|nr:hypothetical protein [Microscillaceae bacterium]
MTKILNNNRFTQICYHPVERLVTQTWKFNAHKNQLHFFGNLTAALDVMYTYNPSRLLINFSDFKYSLDHDSRSWVVNHFLTQLYPLSVNKIALIKSKDQDTQISMELIRNNSKVRDSNIRFFEQESQAHSWFINKAHGQNSLHTRLKAS